MYSKIWHKPLHYRKIWRKMSLLSKIIYYMKPFIAHLLDTWLQPLPFPTILKMIYTCILSVFILLPIIYPTIVVIFIYGELQFILESHFDINFPKQFNLLKYLQHVFSFQISQEKYMLFATLYLERWKVVTTAVASSIDYMRLALLLLYELMES